jgi:hypothetical protein
VVPQFTNKPQDYAKFLGQELKFAYKGPLLIVMQNGYGLVNADPAVAAAVAKLPKPKSNDPSDLASAGADAVVALSKAAGKNPDLSITPPANQTQTTAHAAGSTSSSDSSNTTAIVLIAGGTVGLIVALAGLFWWARRAPEEEAA